MVDSIEGFGEEGWLEDFLAGGTAAVTEVLCDANLAGVEAGSTVQLERKGYFRVDKAAGEGPVPRRCCSRSRQGRGKVVSGVLDNLKRLKSQKYCLLR